MIQTSKARLKRVIACIIALSLSFACFASLATFAPVSAQAANIEQRPQACTNLMSRFLKGGDRSSITGKTWEAAFAAKSMGFSNDLDPNVIINNFVAEKNLSAGQLAKYILALSCARVNCSNLYVDKKYDLISDLEEQVDAAESLDVYTAVLILPIFSNFDCLDYEYDANLCNKAVQAILSAQNKDGLFGTSGYEDVQTTSQAILALLPYSSQSGVASAINKAQTAIMNMQDASSGGFKYSNEYPNLETPDATATAFAALAALGKTNESLATKNGSTPMSFIMSLINSKLNDFEGGWDGELSSSTALLAFAADKQNANTTGRTEVAGAASSAAIYKITNSKKLTAQYVKTYGKALSAKTIKIPNTIKLSSGKTYKVTSIASKAACKQKKATKIKVGTNVSKIGAKAFSACSKVKSIYFGKALKTVGVRACKQAGKLKSITFCGKKLTKASMKNLVKNSKVKRIVCKGKAKKVKAKYNKWFKKYSTAAKGKI